MLWRVVATRKYSEKNQSTGIAIRNVANIHHKTGKIFLLTSFLSILLYSCVLIEKARKISKSNLKLVLCGVGLRQHVESLHRISEDLTLPSFQRIQMKSNPAEIHL